MRSVLVNLVTNAVKYSKPGGKVAVSLRERSQTPRQQATSTNDERTGVVRMSLAHLAEQDGDRTPLQFIITDEGIGIPAADQTRIGEPFHRASNVGDISGTGLGLAVVKRCVELCGGTFTIHSEEGLGTQAVVALPT